jgi:hypothetical protein
MLQELLAGEGKAQPLPARTTLSSQMVLRMLVFALLVIVSVVALGSNSLPDGPDRRRQQLQQVSGLTAGAPGGGAGL